MVRIEMKAEDKKKRAKRTFIIGITKEYRPQTRFYHKNTHRKFK